MPDLKTHITSLRILRIVPHLVQTTGEMFLGLDEPAFFLHAGEKIADEKEVEMTRGFFDDIVAGGEFVSVDGFDRGGGAVELAVEDEVLDVAFGEFVVADDFDLVLSFSVWAMASSMRLRVESRASGEKRELRVGEDELCGRDSRRTSEGNMGQQELNLKYENLLLDEKALRCILFADSMGADRR